MSRSGGRLRHAPGAGGAGSDEGADRGRPSCLVFCGGVRRSGDLYAAFVGPAGRRHCGRLTCSGSGVHTGCERGGQLRGSVTLVDVTEDVDPPQDERLR